MAISQIQTNSMAANSVTSVVIADGAIGANNLSASANTGLFSKAVVATIIF
jgi:hypothetical protein